jgi:hypothetical protein
VILDFMLAKLVIRVEELATSFIVAASILQRTASSGTKLLA